MDIRELLLSRLDSVLINLAVDKSMSKLNAFTEKVRRLELQKYVQDDGLSFEEIRGCMYDYTFKLFIYYLSEAEYKNHKNVVSKLLKGIGAKLMGGSFLDTIGEEYYKLYRTATAKLNIYIQKTILLLLDEGSISQEESLALCDTFLQETHVGYSIMPLPFGSNGELCTFAHALTSVDKKQVNQRFDEKYTGMPLLQHPCKGDYYRILMDAIKDDSNIMFMKNIYNVS